MIYGLLFLLTVLTFTACSESNETITIPPTEEKITFSYENAFVANMNLPYRKAVIDSQTGGRPALAIYLHGGSSRGDNNETQLNEPGVDSISNYLSQQRTNALFLVPQCPADKTWISETSNALKALIDDYIAEESIDSNRIYLLGGSMGGTGT